MAVRKGTKKKVPPKTPSKKSASWAILFWLAFAIFIVGLFLFNRDAIGRSIQLVQNEFSSRKSPEEQVPESALDEGPSAQPSAPVTQTLQPSMQQPVPQSTTGTDVTPGTATDSQPIAGNAADGPGTAGQALPTTQQNANNQQPPAAQEQRDRVLYLTQIDRDGYILRVRTDRKFPVSLSPLTDVIQALITGPNEEEKRKGLVSLVPPTTKILSITIRGDTAYINLSEDFLYNTYGVEGYAGQLRQIVFTATEFPNIRDVQILIEGARVDYLGEGVWIGSPLNRETL